MIDEIKYVESINKTNELYRLFAKYIDGLRIVEINGVEQTTSSLTGYVDSIILKIEEVYNCVKDIDINIFLEYLLLKEDKVQQYFIKKAINVCFLKDDLFYETFEKLKDFGLLYDNGFTQNLKKVGVMDNISSYIYNQNLCGMIEDLERRFGKSLTENLWESAKNKSITIQKSIQEQLFLLLEDYFFEGDKVFLKDLLFLDKYPKTKLLFNGRGNKLAIAFKDLYEHKLITCRYKSYLEKWIIENFKYVSKDESVKDFTESYVNKLISTNEGVCKDPIIKIEEVEFKPILKRP
ncbi:MAG: hypothetical protein HWD89_03360 [Tenacibaculum sp.]|uniref:hypothetical protein n=1 Tax=Tenacibaculum sp. TaxID=1906242 RepID=UPI00178EBD5E|nr:hypothetical protein [Tenacibaculum sp.]NVK08064.1 hypothetical protein [Tenacibaculum sp.]